MQGAFVYLSIDLQHHGLSSSRCRLWFVLQVLIPCTVGSLVHLTLANRILALYNREKWIRRFVILVYIVLVVTVIPFCFIVARPSIHYGPHCQLRTPSKQWPYIVIGFLPMGVDCVFVFLTLFKVASLFRVANTPSFIRIVSRDGVWAFILVTFTIATSQVFLLSGNRLLHDISLNWLVTIFSSTTTHLILNMLQFKSALQSEQRGTTEQSTTAGTFIPLTNMIPLSLDVSSYYLSDKSIHL